jgi:ribosomal protein L28
MPAFCILSGKSYKIVNKRSHSMIGTKTKVKANLQKIKIGNQQVKISARALRTMKKNPDQSLRRLFLDNFNISSAKKVTAKKLKFLI